MSQHVAPDPMTAAAQLAGAMGIGGILLKVVEKMFARRDRGDDVAAGLRKELVSRIESLERNYRQLEESERKHFQDSVNLRSENEQLKRENLWLRERWHAFMTWFQNEPSLPQPPRHLYEKITGPTSEDSQHPRPKIDTPITEAEV